MENERGYTMKNIYRNSIKVVALAFSVLFFIIVSCFAVDYFANPKIVTLGELSAISIDDLASVQVRNATNTYEVYDYSLICDTLSDLILKKEIGSPTVPDDHHVIWFIERNDKYSDILYLSNDCRQLWIVHPEQKGSNQFEFHDEYYEVLNPEILFEADYSRLTTEYVLTEPQPTLNLLPEDVEQITIELDGENILSLDLAVDIDAVCSLLNNMQLSGERPVTNWDCYLRFVISFPNEQIVAISVSPDYTQCIIEVYHEVDGIIMCTAHVHTTVLNPTLFTSSNIILSITSDRTGGKDCLPVK